jgi:serine/threonine protein kinase
MMLGGHQPFEDENVPRLISRITLGEYDFNLAIWSKISFAAKDLIRKMLEISPTMRLSAEQVL